MIGIAPLAWGSTPKGTGWRRSASDYPVLQSGAARHRVASLRAENDARETVYTTEVYPHEIDPIVELSRTCAQRAPCTVEDPVEIERSTSAASLPPELPVRIKSPPRLWCTASS